MSLTYILDHVWQCGTGMGTGYGNGYGSFSLFQVRGTDGVQDKFDFIKYGRSTEEKCSQLLVRTRDGIWTFFKIEMRVRIPYPYLHSGVWFRPNLCLCALCLVSIISLLYCTKYSKYAIHGSSLGSRRAAPFSKKKYYYI